LALTAFFGVFHGFAHGAELPLDASGLTYSAGFVAATGVLHVVGIAAAFAGSKALGTKGRTATRIGSGAIALAGVAVLSGAF
jgi:urease accessory protein